MSSNGTPVSIIGNLTDDPEMRFTPSGVAVARFTVAVNRRVFDRASGEWKDAGTDFHRCQAWRRLAENIAESLTRGARVVVVGELVQDHWEDKESGEKRSGWTVSVSAAGPDLTFATAKVSKTSRGAQAAPDDPWATASRRRPEQAGV